MGRGNWAPLSTASYTLPSCMHPALLWALKSLLHTTPHFPTASTHRVTQREALLYCTVNDAPYAVHLGGVQLQKGLVGIWRQHHQLLDMGMER